MSLDPSCHEKISFCLNARGLPKMDITSHTDAFAVVYINDERIAYTSIVPDSENPDWPDQIILDYQFEAKQKVKIEVYDQDAGAPQHELDKHSKIGKVHFFVSDIMYAKGQRYSGLLDNDHPNKGTLIVRTEPMHGTRDVFVGDFSAEKLANKDGLFGKSDPFFTISRMCEDGSCMKVWQSEVIENNLSPNWSTVKISVARLCNNDNVRPLLIEIFDQDSGGKNESMGQVQTTMKDLLERNGHQLHVIEAKNNKHSGNLFVRNPFIEPHPTFTDYIMGGLEISMVLAIDFTGSNGTPTDPSSLHYIDYSGTGRLNEYQLAMLNIGGVIEQYDTNKSFPIYGFGARVRKPDGSFTGVQHCFPLYSGGVEVQGVEGMLKAYADSIPNVNLSGPTLFGPLLQAATGLAVSKNCTQENQKYVVLLIITDGTINDEEATIASLVHASEHPLSVIIVGVGSEDYTSMRILDGSQGRLRSGKENAVRDNVQFVVSREYSNPQQLAEQTLREIPLQVLDFMKLRGILPNLPPEAILSPGDYELPPIMMQTK